MSSGSNSIEKDQKNVKETTCITKSLSCLSDSSLSSNDEAIQILNALLKNKTVTMEQINHVINQKGNNDNGKNSTSSNNKSNQKGKKKSKKKDKKQRPKVTYMTRHIAFRFHYDGATYNGLAENRNCSSDNSVERALFAALEKTRLLDPKAEVTDEEGELMVVEHKDEDERVVDYGIGRNTRDECKYSRSGRTDKGVSAFGQVIALRVRSAFPVGTKILSEDNVDADNNSNENNLKLMQESDMPKNSTKEINCWVPSTQKKMKQNDGKAGNGENATSLQERTIIEKNFCQILNNVLPTTIRMLGWSPVSNDFSARFSTSSRTYRYFFIKRDLNLSNMQKALDYMVGTHDFRNLCKMNCEEVDNFVRVIKYGKIIKTNSLPSSSSLSNTDNNENNLDYRLPCYFEIQGQAFLWHQIRCIASILFMVGKGLESPSVVKELLDIKTNPAKPSYPFAPDLPLVLHKCEYKHLDFGHTVQNLFRVSCDLEKKWEELTLAAERLRNGIDSLGADSMVSTCDVAAFIKELVAERRKKMERNHSVFKDVDKLSNCDDLTKITQERSHMSWDEALEIIHKYGGGKPQVEGSKVPLHIPLMLRAKGTTYEEKIKSIMATDSERVGGPPSKRRREVYENNIKKKKVSKEEDDLFYKKMLSQGGSGL